MRKLFFALLFALLMTTAGARAQISQNLLLDENAAASAEPDKEAVAKAENSARQLLRQRPQTLRKQNFPKLRAPKTAEPQQVISRTQSAPFGLVWGSTTAETQNQGITLTPIGESDYANNYRAAHLPKPVKDFAQIDLTFGIEDELWRILAYGQHLDDDASASKVLRLYRIYSDLLAQKYGNKQEFFTPAQIDVIKTDTKGKDITVQEPAPIGNPNFLQQLQSGAATLYSTYYNQEVGAALAVSVDGDGKSYIVLDYKNLSILKAREKETLDAL